jgi:hypothetical protein
MASTGKISRAVPTGYPDGEEIALRQTKFGELVTQPLAGGRQMLADEGSYFIATNAAPMTPLATTTSIVTFAQTAGAVGVFFLLKNSESSTAIAAKRVYPDYLKIQLSTQLPTTATSLEYAVVLDDNPVRYTSGGTAITPVNPNTEKASGGSVVTMYAGALTTAVPTNGRLVARGLWRGQIGILMDQHVLVFGGDAAQAGAWSSGNVIVKTIEVAPPVVLGPAWNLAVTLWSAGVAAAARYEFEFGWWEK